ncbi:uracil nucleotide/cysteinyl leukotriene receptor-like [Physella acuta]|uniref:uracil nucleotide/cysteinyl leukotriene receptor-like n=1 Tax=Physella acuta TaxID=109671 RepID=UPI0027DE3446|nr:uracil nucleotide/cysteinyl leukotriene receptor-like [Physella acuta]
MESHNITSQTNEESEPVWISDDARKVVQTVFFVAINGATGFLGSVANVINIVVFVKQGFSDTVNISLLGLAVSDLGSLVTLVWESITLNPFFLNADVPFRQNDIRYLTAAIPHSIFVRIAWCITAFLTLERCLCIAMPLKVKQIITAKRTLLINLTIFTLIFLGMCPIFVCRWIGPEFAPERNKTIFVTLFSCDKVTVENIAFTFNVVAQFSSFIIDLLCTVIIIHTLQVKSKWRNETTSTSKTGLATRDKKVIKMIALISTIFIVCSMPSCVNYVVVVNRLEYNDASVYRNVYTVSWAVIVALEAINSSVNIFVYYNMSGKYKAAFDDIFCRWLRGEKQGEKTKETGGKGK